MDSFWSSWLKCKIQLSAAAITEMRMYSVSLNLICHFQTSKIGTMWLGGNTAGRQTFRMVMALGEG